MLNNEELEGALPSEEAEELGEGDSTPNEGEVTPPSDPADVDFEKRLEEERARLGKKIDKEREKRINAEKDRISKEEVERLIEEKVGEAQKALLQDRAEIIAERLCKTSAEKELTMLLYKTRIVPTGNIQEDIEAAHALANRKTTQATISELQSAIKSKRTIMPGGSDAGMPPEKKEKPKYSQEDIDGAKFAGVSVEDFVKRRRTT